MSWSLENEKHDEASKVRWELVPYFHGRILDIGLSRFKTFPHFIGVGTERDVKVKDHDDLSLFASQTCDGVFSSFLLDKIPYEEVSKTLTEWVRPIKQGGHLVLYLPDGNEYPEIGTGDPEHRWDCTYELVLSAMEQVSRGWDLVDFQVRNEGDEYGLFFAFRLTKKGHEYSHKNPKPEKTCAITRLGAFGDVIQSSSILPWLKSQGYWIDFYCSDHGYPVIRHDPHIDRFIIQGRGEVPAQFLGEFWDYTEKKYDKWINLSESVEVTLLAAHDRSNFKWPNEVRAKYLDRNYIEFTHELAQVPPPYQPKFYSTLEERAWARSQKQKFGGRNVIWSLSGSSVHKHWPHLDAVIARLMLSYPDVNVVLVGDEVSQILEAGWEKEPRVKCRSGKWSIRESMAFCEVADLIIGPETGLLNAAGSMETPKIVTLSHSSPEMLTKHWVNVTNLEQPKGVGCPKNPCRQLHFNWDHCPAYEDATTKAALCQWHITVPMMWNAITNILGKPQKEFD